MFIEFKPSDRTFEYMYESEREITGTENKVHNKNALKGTYVLDAENKTIFVTVTKISSTDIDSNGTWYTLDELISVQAAKIIDIIDAAKACDEEMTVDNFYDFQSAMMAMDGDVLSREEFDAGICAAFELTSVSELDLPENADKKAAILENCEAEFYDFKVEVATELLGMNVVIPEDGPLPEISIDWEEVNAAARAMVAEEMDDEISEVFMTNVPCEYEIDYVDLDAEDFSVRAAFGLSAKYDSSKPWYMQQGSFGYTDETIYTYYTLEKYELQFESNWYGPLEWNEDYTEATYVSNDDEPVTKTFTVTDNHNGTVSLTCDGKTVELNFRGEHIIGMGML